MTRVLQQAAVDAAVTATRGGDLVAASRLWRQAFAMEPENGPVALNLGIVCVGQGDMNGAATGFAAAMATLPVEHRAAALHGLAAVDRGRGRAGSAQRRLRRAIAIAPAESLLWRDHADLARFRAFNGIAHASVLRAMTLAPRQPEIEHAYVLILENASAAAKQQGARRLAGSQDLRVRRAIPALLALAGDFAGALAGFKGLEALLAEDGPLFRAMGCIQFALGDASAAARSYRRAVGLMPALRKGPGDLREIALVAEDALPARIDEGPYRQHLVHAGEAVVIRESWAAILPDGRCYLRRFIPASPSAVQYFDHVVCLHDERMLTVVPDRMTEGPAGAVLIGGCPNFSHWLIDWSSKLRPVLANADLQRRPLIVSDRLPGFARDLMMSLGIDTRRLHPQKSAAARYRDLWLPSMSHLYQELPPAHAAWLRERLAVPATPRGRARRLFMSRRHARHRRIANLAELEPLIRRFGLEEVHPESMTLAAQLELFADAELWVGVVGGGSASILLCPTSCRVVELAHRRVLLDQYERAARTIGQDYRRVVGEVVQPGDRPPEYDFDWDLFLPPEELEHSLAQALR